MSKRKLRDMPVGELREILQRARLDPDLVFVLDDLEQVPSPPPAWEEPYREAALAEDVEDPADYSFHCAMMLNRLHSTWPGMAPLLVTLLSASPGMLALTEASRYLRRVNGRVEPELARAIQAAYHSLPSWRRALLMLDGPSRAVVHATRGRA